MSNEHQEQGAKARNSRLLQAIDVQSQRKSTIYGLSRYNCYQKACYYEIHALSNSDQALACRGNQERTGIGGEIVFSLKTVPQSDIGHIIFVVLAKAGVLGSIEKYISLSDFPIVADLVFCEDLTG
ncbi:MAG: hypothetical protein LWX52_11025 [Deltaproteobacteria bacterium]|nr:hypothetical protein [Deltaproteobacteria bacterium]